MPRTPIRIDAHRMIDAIIAIWPPAITAASQIRVIPEPRLKAIDPLMNNNNVATKIATAAAYCGVKPIYITIKRTLKGIRKKLAVISTFRTAGRASLFSGRSPKRNA